MSRYDRVDTYIIPGTEVLRNQADIADQKALDAFEADATALRMLELAISSILKVSAKTTCMGLWLPALPEMRCRWRTCWSASPP